MFIIFIVLLKFFKYSLAAQKHKGAVFETKNYSAQAYSVLKDAIRATYEKSLVKIRETNYMRFFYEESPFYETGYMFGEIIERYRKSVEIANRTIVIKSNTVFEMLRHTEQLQKLHLEVYHLINMLHEIRLKYQSEAEFTERGQQMSYEELMALNKGLKEEQRKREKERRKRNKLHQKLQLILGHPLKNVKNKTKWWPIEYGWEIDYYW